MRFAVDIKRDPNGHYEGSLAWDTRDEPFEFSGLLELLSVIERELTAQASRAGQGGTPTRRVSGTPRPGIPTTGADLPDAKDPAKDLMSQAAHL